MKKVIIQYDDKVAYFENVTRVQCFCQGDFFEAKIVIYQSKQKTEIKMCEINGFEIKS